VPWMTPLQTVHSYLLWRGFGYREAKRRALETLESVGLGEQSNALNRSLSGGTRRKVMVATVLASEAEIIFLDEPTTGLDPISRRDFWALLQKVGKERFTFLTTHYLEEAEYLAGKIGILDEGHIVSIGALEELRQKIRYNYVLTPLLGSSGFDIRSLVKKGELITGSEGNVRVLTTEEEAFDILRDLARLGLRFTINPLSLDDIFFYLVRKESAS
jgi:ABC-2 type transport system ATP-binding protein